eukprot:10465346-Heterocapsa_arctica.AAC.1
MSVSSSSSWTSPSTSPSSLRLSLGCSVSASWGRRPFHQVFSGRPPSPSSESSHVRGGQPATTTTR